MEKTRTLLTKYHFNDNGKRRSDGRYSQIDISLKTNMYPASTYCGNCENCGTGSGRHVLSGQPVNYVICTDCHQKEVLNNNPFYPIEYFIIKITYTDYSKNKFITSRLNERSIKFILGETLSTGHQLSKTEKDEFEDLVKYLMTELKLENQSCKRKIKSISTANFNSISIEKGKILDL